QLDNQEVDASASRAAQKVELDLDDAPFLDWEEDEEQPAQEPGQKGEAPEEESPEEEEQKPQPGPAWWKRKWLWFLSGAALVLVLAAASLWWFWQEDVSQEEGGPQAALQPEQIPAESEQAKEKVSLEPFWVEHSQGDELRFLHLEFALALEHQDLAREVDRKIPALRDAVYHYLRKKELVFLADKENADQLKSELASLLNQYLSQGQVQEVLIQKYVVQ
ncbi:MAG: flagellar basal body-associated FliL family protein, partial [Desulfohalobiaceae bacterium]